MRIRVNGPATGQSLQGIVDLRGGDHELGVGRAIEVWPSKPKRRLEGAVLVEDNPRCHQHRPGQMITESVGVLLLLGERKDFVAVAADHEAHCRNGDADNQHKY